ncbi:hypothetical protein CANCADRAFT_44567 [Tortispora caseinolytica NRRL Y-17796]|uniref:Origin recognition complex subunit 3 N-terminal domain-containing protein n=1 Tax=Tortispora caseinolytica NRRL Y-17796 TaxID=767744 RepID=A0A1E4TGQ0_9ASCO|nr:hypothetical protein CANCADRAFT_44567 [Tortispora caseinolytica NRRL Y-17796]
MTDDKHSTCWINMTSGATKSIGPPIRHFVFDVFSHFAKRGYIVDFDRHSAGDLDFLVQFYKETGINTTIVIHTASALWTFNLLCELLSYLQLFASDLPLKVVCEVEASTEITLANFPYAIQRRLKLEIFHTAKPAELLPDLFNVYFFDPHPGTIWLGPNVLYLLSKWYYSRSQTVELFLDAVQYSYMCHYYDNPLSLINTQSKRDIRAAFKSTHYQYLRSVPTFADRTNNIETDDKVLQSALDAQNHVITYFEDMQDTILIYREFMSLFVSDYSKEDLLTAIADLMSGKMRFRLIKALEELSSLDPALIKAKIMEFGNLAEFPKELRSAIDRIKNINTDELLTNKSEAQAELRKSKKAKLAQKESAAKLQNAATKWKEALASFEVRLVNMLKPINAIQFYELYVFDDYQLISSALNPEFRARIDDALLLPQRYLGHLTLESLAYQVCKEEPAESLLQYWYASFLSRYRELHADSALESISPDGDKDNNDNSDRPVDQLVLSKFYYAIAVLRLMGLIDLHQARRITGQSIAGKETVRRVLWPGL